MKPCVFVSVQSTLVLHRASDFNISDTATLTIINDDTATFSVADVTVSETAGAATVTVALDLPIEGGATLTLMSADFAPVDAAAGQRLQRNPPQRCFLPVTSTTAQSFSVGIIDDTLVENLVEGTEQFRIDITAVNPVEAIAASAFNLGDTATVSIYR